jgi:hypothetical protein
MTYNHFNRRLHLYLALTLLPWFFMYGISSLPFSHGSFFQRLDEAKGLPLWTKRFEKNYEIQIPEGNELRPVGAQIMRDHGLQGAFGVYRQNPNQVNVYVHSFWRSTQVKYFIAEKKLVAEDRRFRWDHFLTGMHARGGFEQDSFLDKLWGVVVDLVCLGMLFWIITGVYMWWKLPSTRRWGWLALGGGITSFVFFVARL